MSKKKHELLFHQEGQPARLPKELSEHLTSLLLGFNFQNNAPIIGIFSIRHVCCVCVILYVSMYLRGKLINEGIDICIFPSN